MDARQQVIAAQRKARGHAFMARRRPTGFLARRPEPVRRHFEHGRLDRAYDGFRPATLDRAGQLWPWNGRIQRWFAERERNAGLAEWRRNAPMMRLRGFAWSANQRRWCRG